MTSGTRRSTRCFVSGKAIALVGVILGVVGFVWFGGLRVLTDSEGIERFLSDNGVVGPLVFIGIVLITRPLGTPMPVFMIPAAAVWPAPMAIIVYWIGHVGASFISFRAARGFARGLVEHRIPPRLRRYDAKLGVGGVKPVIVARLATRLFALDWLLGLSAVSNRAFVIGTAVGVLPSIALFILASDGLMALLASTSPPARAGLAVGLVGTVLVLRAAGQRRSGRPDQGSGDRRVGAPHRSSTSSAGNK